MKKAFIILFGLLLITGIVYAIAPDKRISDNDGTVLNINSDGSIPVTIASGSTIKTTGDIGTNGNIGAGTTAPVYRLDVRGSGNAILNMTSNVGVGTTAPIYKLDVNGDMRVSGDILTTDQGFTLGDFGTSGNLGAGTTAPVYRLDVRGSGNVILNMTGNVGIGTTAPVALFNVRTSVDTPPSLLADSGFVNFHSGYSTVQLTMGAYSLVPFGFWMQAKKEENDGSSYPLLFNPLGGNVGIGTTNPLRKLSVVGDIVMLPGNFYRWEDADGTFRGAIRAAATSYDLELYTQAAGGGARVTIQNDGDLIVNTGNVGIGTTAPTAKLHIIGTGGTGAGAPLKLQSPDGTTWGCAPNNSGVFECGQ